MQGCPGAPTAGEHDRIRQQVANRSASISRAATAAAAPGRATGARPRYVRYFELNLSFLRWLDGISAASGRPGCRRPNGPADSGSKNKAPGPAPRDWRLTSLQSELHPGSCDDRACRERVCQPGSENSEFAPTTGRRTAQCGGSAPACASNQLTLRRRPHNSAQSTCALLPEHEAPHSCHPHPQSPLFIENGAVKFWGCHPHQRHYAC